MESDRRRVNTETAQRADFESRGEEGEMGKIVASNYNLPLMVKGVTVQSKEREVRQHDWRWHHREIKNKAEPDVDQTVEVSTAGSLASVTRERLRLAQQRLIKTDA